MLNIYPSPEDACKALFSQRGMTAKVARALGLTPGAISQWDKVPAERVVAVSAATGIPAASLRPDLAAAFAAVPAQPTIPEVQALLDTHHGEAA
jgi:transcriptional regulator with XRE-family HTH domain